MTFQILLQSPIIPLDFKGFACTLHLHSFMSQKEITISQKGIIMSAAGACINILLENNTRRHYPTFLSLFLQDVTALIATDVIIPHSDIE